MVRNRSRKALATISLASTSYNHENHQSPLRRTDDELPPGPPEPYTPVSSPRDVLMSPPPYEVHYEPMLIDEPPAEPDYMDVDLPPQFVTYRDPPPGYDDLIYDPPASPYPRLSAVAFIKDIDAFTNQELQRSPPDLDLQDHWLALQLSCRLKWVQPT